jgi:epoxyqueuosine reductase
MLADDDLVERQFEGSPLRRPGAVGLKRNAAVVLGNLGDEAAGPCLDEGLRHPSPLVRGHAAWALRRIEAASHARHDHAGPRWSAPAGAFIDR